MTENVVEEDPAGTVTFAGIIAPEGDPLKPMVAPPVGAVEDKVTVHVEPAEGDTVVGLQARLLKAGVCWIVTVPALTDVEIEVPLESADIPLVRVTGEEESGAEEARVRVTEARTLLGIGLVFSPHTRHVAVPDPLVQERDLLAAPEPAAKLAEVKSAVE